MFFWVKPGEEESSVTRFLNQVAFLSLTDIRFEWYFTFVC